MFGWRKKNDGFVWNEYVRTTVLLRREQRKQRIEDVKDAAVGGIKHAGRRGAELGVAGATAAGRGLWSGFRLAAASLTDWVSVAATATWLWLADRTGPARGVIGEATSHVFDKLRQPAVSAPLLLIGAIAAFSATVRWNSHGFDRDAVIAGTLALLALSAAIVPYVSAWTAGGPLGRTLANLPRGSVANGAGAALSVGATLALIVGALGWLVPALMSSQGTSTASTAGAPVLTPASGRIEGKAVAVAADQLRVGSELVRLFGVEAPDASQTCTGAKSCAANAKAALQKLISGKHVACDVSGRTGEVPPRATCKVNGADIAGQLVRGGHIFATTGLFATYSSAEREARTARAGIWKTDPARPAEHRAKLWEDAKQAAPDGCPIKGVVNADAKTYLVPWSANYLKAKVRQDRGERWFCTEAEAKAAGWKPGEPS